MLSRCQDKICGLLAAFCKFLQILQKGASEALIHVKADKYQKKAGKEHRKRAVKNCWVFVLQSEVQEHRYAVVRGQEGGSG